MTDEPKPAGETNEDDRPADSDHQNNEETPEVDINLLTHQMQVASLKEQLEAALADAARFRSDLQYKEAELQNERRRFAEQRAAGAKYGDEPLLRDLLPAFEGLDLALNADVNDQWGEGVKLALREIKRQLEMRGVSVIGPEAGEPFDPNEHDALGTEETTAHAPGCITQVIRAGYRLHDRVVQPPRVMVARAPAGPDENPSAQANIKEDKNA